MLLLERQTQNEFFLLFYTTGAVLPQMYANLGKADSAIFDDSLGDGLRWSLLRESQFGSLEQNIRYDLIRNISPLRRRNCIDAVLREAQAMLDGLSEIQGRLEAKQQEARNRLNALERFRTLCCRIVLLYSVHVCIIVFG